MRAGRIGSPERRLSGQSPADPTVAGETRHSERKQGRRHKPERPRLREGSRARGDRQSFLVLGVDTARPGEKLRLTGIGHADVVGEQRIAQAARRNDGQSPGGVEDEERQRIGDRSPRPDGVKDERHRVTQGNELQVLIEKAVVAERHGGRQVGRRIPVQRRTAERSAAEVRDGHRARGLDAVTVDQIERQRRTHAIEVACIDGDLVRRL